MTFLGSDVADELHFVAPLVKCVHDALGVSGCGVGQNILKHPLLSAEARQTVPHPADQNGPIQQHEVISVTDDQCEQEWKKRQSYRRRNHLQIRPEHTETLQRVQNYPTHPSNRIATTLKSP